MTGFGVDPVIAEVDQQVEAVNDMLAAMTQTTTMDPGDFLYLQFQMNLLSQLMTTASNVLSAINDACNAAARNIK